ncbi:MAG TPA: hypothetical protein VIT65_29180 [Microlunatus sp.]
MPPDTPSRTDVAAEESPHHETPSAFIRVLRRLEQWNGLDPVVRVVEPLASAIVANERLRRLIHGEATGIALHVVLTDAPFGAWFMAQYLDLFADDGTRRAATRLVGLGIVAAVPTALTGWAEWARADRGARRVGIVHATATGAGTLIFLGSWTARKVGHHDLGVRLARSGGVLLLVGALCGGYMRSDRQAVPDLGHVGESGRPT